MGDNSQAGFYVKTLKEIVSIPTASFFEQGVLAYIKKFLTGIGVAYECDAWGNIIAHYQQGEDIQPLAMMAHTDHPAFELTKPGTIPEFQSGNWTAKLLGGVTAACFEKEPPIRVYRPGQPDPLTFGRVVGHKPGGQGPRDINLYLQLDNDKKVQAGDFGIWDITDFVLSDDYVYARAIDDLIGCAAMLLTFWRLTQEKANANLYGIFTRAEEVGLVGAEMFFQSKVLPKETIVISIEASKTLPGAAQGEGPVIRAGDRAFTFDEPAEFVLKQAALQLGCDVAARTPQTAKIQRQLMTGGRCEAGAAILNGYLATGLAFPLGNYHNVSEHLSLEPEYIHLQDFITGVNLLQQAALLMPELPHLREEFREKEAVKPPLAARLEMTA